MVTSLVRALDDAERDDSVRCLILTGAGPAFSAGGDLKRMLNHEGMFAGAPGELRRRYIDGIQRIPRRLALLDKPIVAAINGAAIGAGLDLACMCDLRIAARGAQLGSTFVKVGLVPGDGGAYLLARTVGFPRALELMLTARLLDTDEAERIGLVHRVVDPTELLPAALALAHQLAALPPEQRAAAAMSPSLVQAAASLPDTSPEFAQLRVDVKAAGAAMGAWDKAVKAARPPPPAKPAQAAARPAPSPAPDPAGPDAWRALLTEERGEIKQSYGNLVLILREAPAYKGRLSYNEMRLTPCLDGVPLGDADVGILRERLERDFGMEMSADNIKQAVRQVAEEQRFHPVRAYLSGLVWDGTHRIDDVARLILGILPPPENEDADPPPPPKPGDPPTPYALAVRMLRAWFTSAVARAMRPGCKVDTALVLIGPQGFLKSTFFSVLGGPFFSDTAMDISGKDGLMQLHSAWIYEWGEIENVTTKKHSAEVKGFITSPSDNFRAPYASAITINKRSGVIVGSTNENQFLNDPTGSRRFHILRITSRVNVPLLKEWRDQLWAEARTLFESGYQWWLADEEDAVREQEAAGYRIEDATTDAIRHWLGGLDAMALLARQKYILAADILQHVMKLDPGRWGRPEQTRVGLAMAELGWVKDRPTVGKSRVWVYRPPS